MRIIAGRVVASDRAQGVSIVRVAPAAVTSIPPVPVGCNGAEIAPVAYDDRIIALAAPMLMPKEGIPGTVGRATPQSNPNGSARGIAGIVNEGGNVLGVMPHPERAADPLLGSADGRRLFEGLLAPVAE